MRARSLIWTAALGIFFCGCGGSTNRGSRGAVTDTTDDGASSVQTGAGRGGSGSPAEARSAAGSQAASEAQAASEVRSGESRNPKYDAQENPTTRSGRGDPSLDDKDRPAAWVYIDGQEGRFVERMGQRLMQWMITQPVGPRPTFKVGVYEPLLGLPRDFKCVLKTVEPADGTYIDYRISASKGTFEVGREYPLLRPGNNFTIRNAVTGDLVQEIGPLSPGTYAIAASIRNSETGKETSAVSYFTVVAGK